jgi:galactokinase
MTQGVRARAVELFESSYKEFPSGVVSAPGRVNLIGDHTDYNGGWVLPVALEVETAIAYRLVEGEAVTAVSEAFDESVRFGVGEAGVRGWGAYLAGVAWALAEAGHAPRPLKLAVASDVPTGAGLSSSAALEVAAARAWREASELALDDKAIAQLCHKAENAYIGIPSGIMDQFASSVAAVRQAILLDCRELAFEVIDKPASWRFVVVDSGVSRQLVGSAYEQRVRECASAAEKLGLGSLRELVQGQLAALDGVLLRRARHVFFENRRVKEAAEAMRHGDAERFGQLMSASHASLRDDYEVSSEALDAVVAAGERFEGCYGARLTGAGFGGCTVHLVDAGSEAALEAHLARHVPDARVVAAV